MADLELGTGIEENQKYQDKVNKLYSKSSEKVNTLGDSTLSNVPKYNYYNPNKDEGPYEQNQFADMDKSYSIVDGTRQNNQNKLWNDLSDQEYQAMFGYAVGNYGLHKDEQGQLRFNKDNSLYDGSVEDTGRLYIGTGKESDQALKIGQARGDMDSSDPRYTPGLVPNYGWESGPEGVDIQEGKVADVLLPKNVANMLEEIRHGNRIGLGTRTADQATEALGSGYSEYYNNPQDTELGRIDQEGRPLDATDVRLTDESNRPVETGLFNFGGQVPEGFDATDTEQVRGLFNQYLEQSNRGLRIPEDTVPRSVQEIADKEGIDRSEVEKRYKEFQKNSQADRMGIIGRTNNLVKGMVSTFGKSLVLDTVDWVGETLDRQTKGAIGWDIGSSEDKQQWMNRMTGYNDTFEQRGNEKGSKYAEKIYDQYQKDESIDWDSAWGLIKTGIETPEYLANSIAYLTGMLIGAGKFTAVGKAMKGAETVQEAKQIRDAAKLNEKVKYMVVDQGLSKNAGLLTMAAGQANNDIDEYKANNNGESPDAAHVMGIVAADTGLLALDRFTDIALLKGKLPTDFITKQKDIVKGVIESTPKNAQMATKLAKHVTQTTAKLTAAGLTEGATEYAQTMGQLMVQQYGSEKYEGESLADLATSRENVVQGIQGAGLGVAMGAEMRGLGTAYKGLTSEEAGQVAEKVGQKAKEFVSRDKEEVSIKDADTDFMEQAMKVAKEREEKGTAYAPETEYYGAMSSKDRVDAATNLEKRLQDRNDELMYGSKTYGSDPVSPEMHALNSLEAVASEKGTVEGLDTIKNNLKDSYGVSEDAVNAAVETGSALYSLKGTGVTGKYSEDVAKEVISGPRGFVTYANNAQLALSTGNEELYSKSLRALMSFMGKQNEKIEAFREGEKSTRAAIEDEVALKIEQDPTTNREDALRSIQATSKKTTPVHWGKDSKAKLPYRLVAEDMLTGVSKQGAGFYGLIDSMQNELELMYKAAGGLMRQAGIEMQYKANPDKSEEPAKEPTKEPMKGTDVLVGDTKEDRGKSESKGIDLTSNPEIMLDTKEGRGKAKVTSNEDGTVTVTTSKGGKATKPIKEMQKFLAKRNAEVVAEVKTFSNVINDKLSSIDAVIPSAYGIPFKTKVNELYKVEDTKLGELDTNALPTGIAKMIAKTKKHLAKELVAPKVVDGEVVAEDASNDPGRLVLFNKDGSINDHTVVGMIASIVDFANTNARELTTGPSDEDMDSMFGDAKITPALRNRFANGGIRGAIAFSDLGGNIVSQLGIKANKANSTEMAALKNSLGTMAAIVMQEEGLIKDMMDYDNVSILNGEAFEESNNPAAVLTLVVGTDKVRGSEELNSLEKELNELELDVTETKTYSFEKPENRKVKIRRQGFVKLNKEHTDAINKLEQTPFKLNSGVEVLRELFTDGLEYNREKLIATLSSNEEGLTKDGLAAARSKNSRVRKLVEEFDKLVEEGKDKDIYFNWFVAKNLRLHLDSATVNPQDDKNISRWLVTATNTEVELSKKTIEEYLDGKDSPLASMFVYSVIQAFDGAIDLAVDKGVKEGNTEDRIREVGRELLKSKNLSDMAMKADHLGHAALAIANIRRYQEAEDIFTSDMVMEVDGITNGLAFKTLQSPVSNPEEWLPRTGILLKGSKYYKARNMNETASMGLDDSYIAGGKKVVKQIIKKQKEIKKGDRLDTVGKMLVGFELIPKVDNNVLENPKGYSFIRNLLKPPMMVFNYAAGVNSIKSKLVEELISGGSNPILEALYSKAKTNPKEFEQFGVSSDSQFVRGLKKLEKQGLYSKDLDVVFVRESLEGYFDEMFASPIATMLVTEFENQQTVNDSINKAMDLMHKAFMEKYSRETADLDAKEQEQWLKDNIDIVPGFWGANSKSDAEKLVVLKTGIEPVQGYVDVKTTRSVVKGGKTVTEEAIRTTPLVRTYTKPGVAASPIGVHGMDSSTMARVLNRLQGAFLAVHDAAVLGISQFDGSKYYNEEFYKLNKEYSMLEAIYNSMKDMQNNNKVYLNSMRTGMKNEIDANQVLATMDQQLEYIREMQDVIFNTDAKIGQMGGVIGTLAEINVEKPTDKKLDGIIEPEKQEVRPYTPQELEFLDNTEDNVNYVVQMISDNMYCKD